MKNSSLEISLYQIYQIARKSAEEINFSLSGDVLQALKKAVHIEKQPSRSILETIIKNNNIARSKHLPLCQDTGMVEAYIGIGSEVDILRSSNLPRRIFSISSAVTEGIKAAYLENRFRCSMVSDPFTRKNTFDNTPVFVYQEEIPRSKNISIGIIAKGGGSENASAIKFFAPSAGWQDVENFIIETVKEKAPSACPPVIVSVALGGNFSSAPLAAKKVFLHRKIGSRNPNKYYAEREEKLLLKINSLGIGPMGLGGKTTALGVFITPLPTHIAALPCAVVIQCHSLRRTLKIL